MKFLCLVCLAAAVLVLPASEKQVRGQAPAKVDFAQDILPVLKERCVSCHGPTQQSNGFRLDRKSAALRGVTRPDILPGSSGTSRLYLRLVGTSNAGTQMPPTGALPQEQIELFRRWIDQGADWPDALANEAELPPPDLVATRLIEAIRARDTTSIQSRLDSDAGAINRRGPHGSTPLMYAALYGDATLLDQMLKAGGDVNRRNDFGATALIWALDAVDKVRLLLDHGADVNARSDFGRNALTIAAGQAGSAGVLKLLLARGAVANSPGVLTAAAFRGDLDAIRVLLDGGARDTGAAVTAALRANCFDCVEAIVKSGPVPPLRNALVNLLPPLGGRGDAEALRVAIERGADVNARDGRSRSVLMLASISDAISADSVKLLVERGADLHAKSADGHTALDFAGRLGNTSVVDVLRKAGATAMGDAAPPSNVVRRNTIEAAVQRSLPLLQRSAIETYKKSACVTCHQNSLAEMSVAAARAHGFRVDETLAQQEIRTTARDVADTQDHALQGIVMPGGFSETLGYVLIGMAAERQPASAGTDAVARLLRLNQAPDGHWWVGHRPPLEASEFTATAVSMRGIQLYAPKDSTGTYDNAIRAAASWLVNARPATTEDRVFRVFGLTWARVDKATLQPAVQELVKEQRADGGWAQLPSLTSDAYATGESLVALREAGMSARDAIYQRGVQFLLTTQLEDGSWFVRSRSIPTQIYFESGFPHGVHQFISATATNWAMYALALAR